MPAAKLSIDNLTWRLFSTVSSPILSSIDPCHLPCYPPVPSLPSGRSAWCRHCLRANCSPSTHPRHQAFPHQFIPSKSSPKLCLFLLFFLISSSWWNGEVKLWSWNWTFEHFVHGKQRLEYCTSISDLRCFWSITHGSKQPLERRGHCFTRFCYSKKNHNGLLYSLRP